MIDRTIPCISVLLETHQAGNFPRYALPQGFVLQGFRPEFHEGWCRLLYSLHETDSMASAAETFANEFEPHEDLLPKQCLIVTDSAGRVAATASLWPDNVFGEVRQHIHWVAVREDCHGKGIAKAMLSRLMELYQETGGDGYLYLISQTWNYKALNLYAGFGFQPRLNGRPVNWPSPDFEAEQARAWKLIREKLGVRAKAGLK